MITRIVIIKIKLSSRGIYMIYIMIYVVVPMQPNDVLKIYKIKPPINIYIYIYPNAKHYRGPLNAGLIPVACVCGRPAGLHRIVRRYQLGSAMNGHC